jgi:hypothetical protein
MKPKRRKRAAYDLPAIRRGEIERHALRVGAACTEDFWRWLVVWVWHNDRNIRDPAGALMMAASRMGGSITGTGAKAILEQAGATRQHRTADRVARFLGVTDSQRTALCLTTIGSIDVRRTDRMKRRREQHRVRLEHNRRGRGAKPRAEYEANSLSRTKPWKAEGISRPTWYRKRETSPSAAIPPLKSGETSPSAPFFLSAALTPVSPEGKQGGLPGVSLGKGQGEPAPPSSLKLEEGGGTPTSLVLEGGVLLTRRWIAAREKACGLRHNSGCARTRAFKEAAEAL